MTLGEYLKASSRLGWIPGVEDCCTYPSGWVMALGYSDPMAEWRGRYSTDNEARALIAEAGGLAELWDRGLSSVEWRAVVLPREGDVGVIVGLGEDRRPEHVGAIYTGKRWAFRAPAGVFVASAEIVGAWTP